jgi:hypothetical protein
MQSSMTRAICLALLATLPATAGQAQELAGSFDQLRVLVKTGDKVRVTDSRGQDVRGSIADVSSSSLALTVGGTRRTFLEADIAAVHQRRNDSLANGARWGFVVGAGLGLLAGITIATEYDGSSGTALIPILGFAYGGIGAGAGAGVDAMHSSERAIYARRGAASKMSLRPILTADRKGVLASLAFGGS